MVDGDIYNDDNYSSGSGSSISSLDNDMWSNTISSSAKNTIEFFERICYKYGNTNVNNSISEFIGSFSTDLEFEDLISERFRRINTMEDLMMDCKFLLLEVQATCSRIIQQCVIDNNQITTVINNSESLINGIMSIPEIVNLEIECRADIARISAEELSTRNNRSSLILGIYETHKNSIIDRYIFFPSLTSETSGWVSDSD